MNLLTRLKGGSASARDVTTIDEYAALMNSFTFNGLGYSFGSNVLVPRGYEQTLAGTMTEMAPNTFVGLASQAYGANGVVFACMMVRQLLFSTIRFQWQRLRNGKPSDTYGTPELGILEQPWVGGTTQDLLSKVIQHADLAGNAYVLKSTSLARLGTQSPNTELVVLRPDWVDILVEPLNLADGRGKVGYRRLGYVYTERAGQIDQGQPVGLHAEEVAHFAPIPDPLGTFRGMSWLTPILREIQADHAMTTHQRKFFDNGATPNLVIKHFPGAPGVAGATKEAVEKWVQEFEGKHAGAANAYKTLQLYPGADVTVVGSNLKDVDFKQIRGGGETRIAAAAGVPPIIVGLSEGLEAATYSNYGQARRRLADGTAHPLWQNLSGSFQRIVPPPDQSSRLWYDSNNVPFLREDESDAASIQNVRAQTINTLITAGYEPDSVVAAVQSGDFGLLVHSGLTSVQLLPPGASPSPADTGGSSNGNG